MSFEGMSAVKTATGDYPVYPGHPLTVAWQIMAAFPGPSEALATVTTGGLNCPEAVADSRISGAGGEVHRGCDLLRKAQQGIPANELIAWADECWTNGQAGGHLKAIEPGLAQAEILKPLFAEKLAAWLSAGSVSVRKEPLKMLKVSDQEYRSADDSRVMRRETASKTPNGNPMNGRWVLRDAAGAFLDFDQYSNDLAERSHLRLH